MPVAPQTPRQAAVHHLLLAFGQRNPGALINPGRNPVEIAGRE